MSILKKGLAGEPVKILQTKLGVPADGQFGSKTEEALKAYQKEHGLSADGIAGPDTFAALGLYELILLKVGTSGETVKKLQTALGTGADGKFGAGTKKAVGISGQERADGRRLRRPGNARQARHLHGNHPRDGVEVADHAGRRAGGGFRGGRIPR